MGYPGLGGGVFGCEIGSISVESEISMSGVMRVDEGVSVRVFFDLIIFIEHWCGNSLGLNNGCGGTDGCGSRGRCGFGRIERCGLLTGGTNVITFKDSETVFTGGIFDGYGFTVFIDIRILSDTFTLSVSFFPENFSVLRCKCGSGTSVSGIETLLFQNFSVFWVNSLSGAYSNQTTNSNLQK